MDKKLKKKFYAKVYYVSNEILLACCDKDICGKVFENNDIVLNVKEEFYKGTLINEEEAIRLLNEATIINIVGKEIVSLAIKIGLVDKENVIEVQNIPHAQVFKI